jgi:hypothetical protein
MLRRIVAGARGGRPSLRQGVFERQVVDLLAAEFEAAESAATANAEAKPKRRGKRGPNAPPGQKSASEANSG